MKPLRETCSDLQITKGFICPLRFEALPPLVLKSSGYRQKGSMDKARRQQARPAVDSAKIQRPCLLHLQVSDPSAGLISPAISLQWTPAGNISGQMGHCVRVAPRDQPAKSLL